MCSITIHINLGDAHAYHSIVVPEDGYLAKCHELCKKHNVLLICDEIQTVRFYISNSFVKAN